MTTDTLRMITTALALAAGAILGAALRYGVGLWATERLGSGFPYGTLIVNLVGSVVLGAFAGFVARHPDVDAAWRLFIATGFCGSLTTFSTLSLETVALFERGHYWSGALNAFGSLGLGLLAIVFGMNLSRVLFPG